MGRKPTHYPAAGASNKRVFTFVGVGFLIGLSLGYICMGTIHAFLEIGAGTHHSRDTLAAAAGAADVASVRRQAAEQQEPLVLGGGQQHAQRDGAGEQEQPHQIAMLTRKQRRRHPKRKHGEQLWPTTGDTIHVLATSNGSPYLNFQTRIMYATFKLVQQMPGGDKMVAFTRILHRTKPDVLMSEVPTFRADPMTPQCDDWCEYPVADRPNAVRQFLDAAKRDYIEIKAPWLYMIETDYTWVKPLAAPCSAEVKGPRSLAFPFGYIQPTHPDAEKVMRRYYPNGPLTDIPNTGPAPALLRVEEWMQVTPRWEAVASKIEGDPQAVETLGWVREMYAFSLALALEKIPVDLTPPPYNKLIVQPPADHTFGEASAAHYTWGAIIKDSAGNEVWQFDKRTYTGKELETKTPYITEPLPDWQPGWRLQDGVAVDKELHGTLLGMLRQMNRGIATLKDIPEA